ncbi:hypothetical protein [Dehalobacter sp. CF]|jgi:hypothetical protein|nr:hypothetical protein [Dehalobacter sp. CF]
MKGYIKPQIEYIKLTAEEKFASPSKCIPSGYCHYVDSTGKEVVPYNF